MRRRRGFESIDTDNGSYRIFRIVYRLRQQTWIGRLQAYSCEQALKKFHQTQSHLRFSRMASVLIIQESAAPKCRTSGGDRR